MVRATDAAAQLMQLGQSKFIGPLNNDGIGVGDINPCFDNRGTDQNVMVLMVKVRHDFLERLFAQLSMRYAN